MKIHTLTVLVLAMATELWAQDCFEDNVNIKGNNVGRGRGISVSSPEECQKNCQKEATCAAFTVSKSSRMCFLKTSKENSGPSRDSISGPKDCPAEPPKCHRHHHFDSVNVLAAMSGYDTFIGNPFDTIVDPGVKATIFDPDCAIVLESGSATGSISQLNGLISASQYTRVLGFYDFISRADKDLNCNSDFSMKSFKSLSEYDTERTQSNEAEISGSVTANANVWGVAMKASASYSRATNSDERAASKVLNDHKGEIILAEATCITESVSIAKEVRPMFTRAFIMQLENLDRLSSNRNVTLKEAAVRELIHEFGTHFSQKTFLGASLTYERRFTSTSTGTDTDVSRKDCVKEEAKLAVSAQHAVGGGAAGLNGTQNACNGMKDESKFSTSEGIEATRIISRGSRPKTMEKWVGEDFTPVPIKRYLTPLSYLFKDEWLSMNEHYGFERSLSGTKISKIYDDAAAHYCSLMLGDIMDDNCNIKVCNDYDCGLKGECKLDIATQQPYCDCGSWAYGDHCEHVIPTCDDGEMNQEETGIDCGGPCQTCHCKNGILDGDETGIDCGGSCGTDCNGVPIIPADCEKKNTRCEGTPIREKESESWQDCGRMCHLNDECSRWTYRKQSGNCEMYKENDCRYVGRVVKDAAEDDWEFEHVSGDKRCMSVPYVKMEKAEPCAPGMHLTRDECEEAAKVAAYMGITLLDSKPEGRLNMDVPSYCSYQAGGHQKFLYNTETHENTFSSKSFLSGEFKSICRNIEKAAYEQTWGDLLDVEGADCDCSYVPKGFFEASGCEIEKEAPKGYRCKCYYEGAWTCGGAPKRCHSEDSAGCNGCKGKECCTGDCDGY